METKGFSGNEISEQNKEALQSETWQKASKAVKTEIRHFINELYNDDPYGYPWEKVVDEYLINGYKEECSQYEFMVLGVTYKVLKREKVTVFYDENGNTLFDVENERLEMEYGWMMDSSTGAGIGTIDPDEGDKNAVEAEEKSADLKKEEADKETGEIQEEKPEEKSGDNVQDDDTTFPDPASIKQMAKKKLGKEMKADKNKTFAEPVIGYLLKRCEEDLGLATDVVQKHKTWKKCFDYIYGRARKQAVGNRAAVRDDVVYEWAEDYYHKDDKAEEEKKAKEAAERKKKEEERKKKAAEQKKADKKNPKQDTKKEERAEEKFADQPKIKKKPKEMDGQMDLFSMMDM